MIEITEKFNNLRKKIDNLDKEILELIIKREEVVKKVGELKNNSYSRIYIPERENDIFKKLSDFSSLSYSDVKNIFTEIISFCRKKEKIFKIGYDDISSLLAIKNIFGSHITPVFSESFKNDFDYFIVPAISKNLKQLLNKNWQIINYEKILNNTFFVFSKIPNEIKTKNDIFFVTTNKKINSSSIEIDKDLFLSSIYKKELNKTTNFKIIGFSNNILK